MKEVVDPNLLIQQQKIKTDREIAMNFKRDREALGLSLVEAAKICNVSHRTWEKWEQGERRVPSFADTFIDYIRMKQIFNNPQ